MVFPLARFSEAFLILRAQTAALPIALAPLVLVVMNAFYALAAYPAGVLSDRFDRITVLAIGFALLVAADLTLAASGALVGVTLGHQANFIAGAGFTAAGAARAADRAPADAEHWRCLKVMVLCNTAYRHPAPSRKAGRRHETELPWLTTKSC
jgi:MFS family permease